MGSRILFGILLIAFLSGCATTAKKQDVQMQSLKHHIVLLETELDRKDEEIRRLEDELTRREAQPRVEKKESKAKSQSGGFPPSIKQIQTALKNAGFYRGSIDGKMGPKTKEAIKAFQKANGLKADGVVGKKTQLKLGRYVR